MRRCSSLANHMPVSPSLKECVSFHMCLLLFSLHSALLDEPHYDGFAGHYVPSVTFGIYEYNKVCAVYACMMQADAD